MYKRFGMTNGQSKSVGMINGTGRLNGTSGLINGCGRINGNSGKINGCDRTNGLINGCGSAGTPTYISGMVNGFRSNKMKDHDIVEITSSHYYRKKSNRRKAKETIGVIVFTAILMALPFIATYTIHNYERIAIDGLFNDWNGIPLFSSSDYIADENSNPNIKIDSYAGVYADNSLAICLKTNGTILNGLENSMDKINIFIDTDNNSETGYKINGIGADYMTEINGYNNSIDTSLISYHEGSAREWSWKSLRETKCALSKNQLELKVHNSYIGKASIDVIVITVVDADSNIAITEPFKIDGTATHKTTVTKGETDTNSSINIDGVFGDWKSIGGNTYEKSTRTGITQNKQLIEKNTASFYIRTKGDIFVGCIPSQISKIPIKTTEQKPSNTSKTTTPSFEIPDIIKLPEGNDTMIVQMDSNYRIFIKGIYREVYQSELQRYNGTWNKVKDIATASNESETEIQVTDMPAFSKIKVYVSDFKGIDDEISDTIAQQTFAPVVKDNQIAVVIDGSTFADTTYRSHQRNVYRDLNGYYWAFFNEDTTVVLERSDDTSATAWTGSQTSVTTTQNCHSLWECNSTNIYISYCEAYDIKTRNGALSGNPTTLSLAGEKVAFDGSVGDPYNVPYLTQDTSGYLWITAQYYDGANYKVNVRKSSNANDDNSWNTVATISGTSASSATYGIILKQASQDMYAIWRLGTALQGKRYTHSNTTWWTQTDSIATLTATIGRDFSGVVDSSNNIHLTYIDNDGKLVYKKRTGTTWGSASGLDTNNDCYYCSVTINMDNDQMAVFYARGTTVYECYKTTSVWSLPQSLLTGITGLKWVNSPYCTSGSVGNTIFIYTSGTSPYNANSNTADIPELNEIIKTLMPITIPLICASIFIYRRRK